MENRDVDWYLDEAKRGGRYGSDNQLSRAIGVTKATVSAYRHRRQWPSDDAMIKIAEIAGLDPYKALMDLNTWRAATPAARTAYRRLAELVGGTMAAVLIGVFLSSGAANAIGTDQAERYTNRETIPAPNLSLMRQITQGRAGNEAVAAGLVGAGLAEFRLVSPFRPLLV